MAQYKWEVRSTGRPFGPCEKLEAHHYSLYSRHTTLSAARKAAHAAYAEMQRYCGPHAWSDHFCVFPAVPMKMVGAATCGVCGKERRVSYVWQPEEFDPWSRLRDSLCEMCRRLSPEEAYMAVDARHRREYPEEAAAEDEYEREFLRENCRA